MITYTIDQENFCVKVFSEKSTEAFLNQPTWPDGTPWESEQSARSWAQLFIASIEDEAAPFAPASPGSAGKPKPTAEEIAQWQAQYNGMIDS